MLVPCITVRPRHAVYFGGIGRIDETTSLSTPCRSLARPPTRRQRQPASAPSLSMSYIASTPSPRHTYVQFKAPANIPHRRRCVWPWRRRPVAGWRRDKMGAPRKRSSCSSGRTGNQASDGRGHEREARTRIDHEQVGCPSPLPMRYDGA
jgi:hypothetical protein